MTLRTAGISYLSPSQAATLTQCERRWWWERQGLKDAPTEAMAMGTGLATALEHTSLERGLLAYQDARPDIDLFIDPEIRSRDSLVARATIREAYDGYVTRWDAPGAQREVTYVVDLDPRETSRLLQVRIDGVTPTHLIEDKLRSGSSVRAEDLENEVRQGRQLTAEIYVHHRVTGDLLPVRLRCVKKIDPRKVKHLRLAEDIDATIGEHFTADNVFQEFEATRTLEQLEQFEDEMVNMALRADDLMGPGPNGQRNTRACHMFGRACPALAHCQGLATTEEVTARVAA
jgi:hypothetical protein